MEEHIRTLIISALNARAAELNGLGLLVHRVHVNLTGPDFSELHQFFGELYEQLLTGYSDRVMERVRALGGVATEVPAMLTSIPTAGDGVTLARGVRTVLREVLARLSATRTQCAGEVDPDTYRVLDDIIHDLNKPAWMLDQIVVPAAEPLRKRLGFLRGDAIDKAEWDDSAHPRGEDGRFGAGGGGAPATGKRHPASVRASAASARAAAAANRAATSGKAEDHAKAANAQRVAQEAHSAAARENPELKEHHERSAFAHAARASGHAGGAVPTTPAVPSREELKQRAAQVSARALQVSDVAARDWKMDAAAHGQENSARSAAAAEAHRVAAEAHRAVGDSKTADMHTSHAATHRATAANELSRHATAVKTPEAHRAAEQAFRAMGNNTRAEHHANQAAAGGPAARGEDRTEAPRQRSAADAEHNIKMTSEFGQTHISDARTGEHLGTVTGTGSSASYKPAYGTRRELTDQAVDAAVRHHNARSGISTGATKPLRKRSGFLRGDAIDKAEWDDSAHPRFAPK